MQVTQDILLRLLSGEKVNEVGHRIMALMRIGFNIQITASGSYMETPEKQRSLYEVTFGQSRYFNEN